MTLDLALAPVRVGTGTEDEEGRLVFAGDRLVAVLVRLAEGHEAEGHWFLEHGFGRLDVPLPPTFSDLQAAEQWIATKLSGMVDGHATTVPIPGRRTQPS
ncbi:hypothetical protein [Muricoccus aerilatus]|uniref:hypothetical protein n=1 Tax=Muricoccus aerilatus TaxID=452982 RepID=UPI001B809FE6|nr:hypothetical protein [Roseomonas aerilata]